MNISLPLMNSILQYLGNRPYIEVVQFFDQIKQEASVQGISASNSTGQSTVPVPVAEPAQDTSSTSSETTTE
jgi:hypothetical protein